MPAVGDQHRQGPIGTNPTGSLSAVTANPFEASRPRVNEYTAQEIATLQSRLDKQLGPEYISSRPGAGGQKVHYLAAEKCINLANEVFGFNGWSSSIQNIQIDFVDENPTTGKICLGLSVIVRVTLRDGTYHEDIGYGHIENVKGKAAAFEKAKKEGTTDAMKRALRTFGNVLGNCIYDKDYLTRVTKVKVAPSKWHVDNLHRHPDYAPKKEAPQPTIAPKQLPEDDDLPPRPTSDATLRNSSDINSFDLDGEFGSDVFDEADFAVAELGNPDEISLDQDPSRNQSTAQKNPGAPPTNNFRGPPRPTDNTVTPSKPERSWTPGHAPPQQPPISNAQNSFQPARPSTAMPQPNLVSTPKAQQNTSYMKPPMGQNSINNRNVSAPIPASGPLLKENPGGFTNNAPNKERFPSNTPPMPIETTGGGFFSARAAEVLQSDPQAATKAAHPFDPRAESPSIRKTAGFDHNKSAPTLRDKVQGAAPSHLNHSPSSQRDFINPSADVHRRIGAPAGVSPLSRGSRTSSYRPPTRITGPTNPGPPQSIAGPQNINGKRPPLGDVTNAPQAGDVIPTDFASGTDLKRPRVANGNTSQQDPRPQANP